VALDDAAALAMAMAYEETNTIGGWHQLHFAPGIDRNAVLAQARHAKRWPNGEPAPAMAELPHEVKDERPLGSHAKEKKEEKPGQSQVARR
jgi:hypothetical protein